MLKNILIVFLLVVIPLSVKAELIDYEAHIILKQKYDNIDFEHPFTLDRVCPTIKLEKDNVKGSFSFEILPETGKEIELREAIFEWDYDPLWLEISGGYFKKEFWHPKQSNRFKIPTAFRGEAVSELQDYGIIGKSTGLSCRFRTPDKKYTLYTQIFESNLPNKRTLVIASEAAPFEFLSLRFNASYIPAVDFKVSTRTDTTDFVALEAGGKIGYDYLNLDVSAIHTDDAKSGVDQTLDAIFYTLSGGTDKIRSAIQYERLKETKAIGWRQRELKKEYYAWDISYYPVDDVRLQLCYRLSLDYEVTGAERENDEVVLQAQFNF